MNCQKLTKIAKIAKLKKGNDLTMFWQLEIILSIFINLFKNNIIEERFYQLIFKDLN